MISPKTLYNVKIFVMNVIWNWNAIGEKKSPNTHSHTQTRDIRMPSSDFCLLKSQNLLWCKIFSRLFKLHVNILHANVKCWFFFSLPCYNVCSNVYLCAIHSTDLPLDKLEYLLIWAIVHVWNVFVYMGAYRV